ncbi:unnamed protein product [Rotaria sp. Silwood1]|nr:unnamed protein product [Rotaria sp. Silwood1]
MICVVQKSKSDYNQEQLSLKFLADREKEQSKKHENTDEEMKKLIDQEHQLLSKQKSLQDEQKKAQLLVAANALIGAGDVKVKLISDELIKVTNELLKI